MRELEAAEVVQVEHIATNLNRADFLTKPLDDATFLRHRAASMNTPSQNTLTVGKRGGCRCNSELESVTTGKSVTWAEGPAPVVTSETGSRE